MIHCVTKKGKGYYPAESSADKYHGVSKFDIISGEQSKSKPNAPSYTSVFGKALVSEASRDHRIVAVTAAMPSGTGINLMQKEFPKGHLMLVLQSSTLLHLLVEWLLGA